MLAVSPSRHAAEEMSDKVIKIYVNGPSYRKARIGTRF